MREFDLKLFFNPLSIDFSRENRIYRLNVTLPKSAAYDDYQRALLIFFMDNLGIEERDTIPFNPLKRLEETHSIGQVYREFESAWRAQEESLRFHGIFKLLPLLRLFQQFLLLAPHTGIIAMEKFLSEDLFAKIVGERPVGMPTKKIHFEFKNERLMVKIWRQGALDQPISQELHQRRRQAVFNHFSIASTVTFQASIRDMGTWEADTSFHLQQDAEHIDNFHPTFLKRYAELIVVLNVMGVPYTIEKLERSDLGE